MIALLASCVAGLLLGALGRRIAGGLGSQWAGVDLGTQLQRLAWGVVLAGVAAVAGATWWQAAALIPAIWLGSVAFGFWGSMTAGHQVGRSAAIDWLLLTAHGAGGMLFAAAGAWWVGLHWLPLSIAGLACAPCYALAWWRPWQIPWLGCYRADPVYQTDPPPTAELLWGACVGVAVALTP